MTMRVGVSWNLVKRARARAPSMRAAIGAPIDAPTAYAPRRGAVGDTAYGPRDREVARVPATPHSRGGAGSASKMAAPLIVVYLQQPGVMGEGVKQVKTVRGMLTRENVWLLPERAVTVL